MLPSLAPKWTLDDVENSESLQDVVVMGFMSQFIEIVPMQQKKSSSMAAQGGNKRNNPSIISIPV
jgi:hypothetical protein